MTAESRPDERPEPIEASAEGDTAATVEELYEDLSEITRGSESSETAEDVTDITHLLAEAHGRGLIDSGIRDLDARDAAEAFVGSVIFASPLLVEDGVFEIGEYLFEFTLGGVPLFLVANTLFVILMTYALLEWTGRNTTESSALFGVVPIRVFMVLAVSFVVATILMTVWGRADVVGQPIQALARINVIWTVGSLGAALGDIVSENSPSAATTAQSRQNEVLDSSEDVGGVGPDTREAARTADDERYDDLSDGELVDALSEQFRELESSVDSHERRREVERLKDQTVDAALDDMFGVQIQKYTSRDIAEAFVGSIFFSIPFLVEDGVFDVAEYFLSFRVGFFPVFFLINAGFVLGMILALVYWAGPQKVRVSRPIFGFIPRRLVGISVVSFLTAAALMTMWGRVDNWEDPVVALARISVVWTVASFGASLGDILPGESSGTDINDDLAALGERAGGEDGRRKRGDE